MSNVPSKEAIEKALRSAGEAHHDYEANFLEGKRDDGWAGWYAAYVLGRLGDFASPSALTRWLADAPSARDWASAAAQHVEAQLRP